MSENVINLRMFRKAKARSEAEKQAQENRAKFGQTKAEKNARRAEKNRSDATHESGRIEGVGPPPINPTKRDEP
ncbi:MAG: DUF4169 family protein [Rhabdaerophilum sp.]